MVQTRAQRAALLASAPPTILDMPSVVMENVFDRLSSFDVLSFALVSPKFTNIVKACRINRTEDPIRVQASNSHVTVLFKDQNPVRRLEMYTDENLRGRYELEDVQYSGSLIYSVKYWKEKELTYEEIHSKKVRCETFSVYYPQKELQKAAKAAINLICSIFRKPVTQVTVHMTQKINKNFILDFLHWRCDDVRVDVTLLEHSELVKFLNKMRIAEGLLVSGDAQRSQPVRPSDVPFQNIKDLDFLVLPSAPWFQDEQLLAMNAKYLEIRESRITNAGLNQWFQRWMDSTEKHVEVLVVTTKKSLNPIRILEGIEIRKSKEVKFPQMRKFGSFTRIFYVNLGKWETMEERLRQLKLKSASRELVYRVTRKDGAVATFSQCGSQFTIFMTYR